VNNIFMVKDGVIFTPKTGILKGTVRGWVIAAARRRGMDLEVRDFTLNHLYEADEAFITNAPRGVVPVKKVDGRVIGAGRPGPVTKKIMAAYKVSLERVR
jgi:branched-chain amino acid aminotransferase